MFALIVTGSERRADLPDRPIVGAEGDRYWVVLEPDGWVEATSARVSQYKSPPPDTKIFKTREEAEKFANRWGGHPWWCKPIKGKHEIVEVAPRYRQVLEGYDLH